jgi:hypothetical protein
VTVRILRIELRRSAALPTAILITACGFGLLYLLIGAFGSARSWFSIVVTQRDMFTIVCPLALGAGAWQARRDRRSGMEELLVTTPRPRLSRVFPVSAALALVLCVAYVVTLGLAGATNLWNIDAYFPRGALPVIAVGGLALIAAAWLGLAVGSLLPRALTPPVLTVLGIVALVILPQSLAADAETRPGIYLLTPAMQNPVDTPVAFTTVSAQVNLSQALWLAALAGTGLALFAAASRRARALAVVPAILGAAVAVPLLPDRSGDMYVLDPTANTPACTSDAPTVCVNRVDRAVLPDWVAPSRQALAILATKLAPAPKRVEIYQWVAPDVTALPGPTNCPANTCPHPARSPQTLVFEFGFRGYNEAIPVPTHHYVWFLLAGAGAGPCDSHLLAGSGVDNRYLAARWAAAAWLIGADLPPDLNPVLGEPDTIRQLTTETLGMLSTLPLAEQRARVAALRDAELRCAPGDRTAILTAGAP